MSGASAPGAAPPNAITRLRTLVRLRPLVYAVGLGLGLAAVATGIRAIFYVMCAVLLSPAIAALLARAARPTRAHFTFEGKVATFFAVGFLAAALNTGTNLLYFLFAALVALHVASLVASGLVFRGLYVRRRVPARVRAREEFDADVTVKNEKRYGSFGVFIEEARPALLDPKQRPAAFIPAIGGRRTARAAWTTSFTRRGEHTLEGVALETRFPFGLIARRIEIAAPQEVLVLPATFRVKPELLARASASEGVARRLLLTEERRDVVRSLRDYRPGDHPRSIHWRASAHRGTLVVKDFEKTEPERALVVLDTFRDPGAPPPGAREGLRPPGSAKGGVGVSPAHERAGGTPTPLADDALEAAVSLAASLLTALRDRGMKVGLAARTPLPEVHPPDRGTSVARLHAALARLTPPGDGDLAALVQKARPATERARVILVTTRPEAAAREALAGLALDLVLPVDAEGALLRYKEEAAK